MRTQQNRREPRVAAPSYPLSTLGIAKSLAPGVRTLPAGIVRTFPERVAGLGDRETVFLDHLVPPPDRDPADIALRFERNFFLCWPPNVFAFTSYFFDITGAYALIVSDDWLRHAPLSPGTFERTTNQKASRWREHLAKVLDEPTSREVLLGLVPESNIDRNERKLSDGLDALAMSFGVGIDTTGKWQDGPEFRNALQSLVWLDDEEDEFEGSYLCRCWDTFSRQLEPPRDANPADIWNAQLQRDESGRLIEDDAGQYTPNPDAKALMALWQLHTLADVASTGWGIRDDLDVALPTVGDGPTRLPSTFPWKRKGKGEPSLSGFLQTLMSRTGNLSFVSSDRARVLPKRHTPSLGISLRAGSAALAFHRSSINVQWWSASESLLSEYDSTSEAPVGFPPNEKPVKALNVLLFPWPKEVLAQDFRSFSGSGRHFFSYEPGVPESDSASPLAMALEKVLKETNETVAGGRVDLLVLPESSISEKEFPAFLDAVDTANVKAFMVGVRVPAKNQELHLRGPSKNELRFGWREGNGYTVKKYWKHHRWQLNRRQVEAYSLGTHVPSSSDMRLWEHIQLGERTAVFANFDNDITVSGIICEDLARQGSLSELIRSVGPNLLVTILMDGAQKADRWPARYAGIFGEDPGCAVLTLTSAGMLDRSGIGRANPSRSVALWSDRGGAVREIDLPSGKDGILLVLHAERTPEETIDGRREQYSTYSLTLTSEVPIPTPRTLSQGEPDDVQQAWRSAD